MSKYVLKVAVSYVLLTADAARVFLDLHRQVSEMGKPCWAAIVGQAQVALGLGTRAFNRQSRRLRGMSPRVSAGPEVVRLWGVSSIGVDRELPSRFARDCSARKVPGPCTLC